MKFAMIIDGVASGVTSCDPSTCYTPDVAAQFTYVPPEVEDGWVLDGGAWKPPAGEVPSSCSPAQGLIALYALKQITEQDILTAIGQIPDPVQKYTATIGYQRATTWERESTTMAAMAALLGLSNEDVDALFTYAAQVRL